MGDYTVSSYTIAHYGRDFIGYSLKSVHELVDRLYVFYTPHPSHGHRVDVLPIESRDDIMRAIVDANLPTSVSWAETDIWHEGQQRDYALSVSSQDSSLVLVVDYDEIWPYTTLKNVLDYVWQANAARNWLLNFAGHFWRSFNWVCHDNNWPVRVIDTRHSEGVGYIPTELGPVWHFGYAISDATLRYKLSIHGHKNELRPNWYEDKWQAWPPVDDCHPTNGRNDEGIGWWNPKPFDKRELPYVLHSHPWFNVDKIE